MRSSNDNDSIADNENDNDNNNESNNSAILNFLAVAAAECTIVKWLYNLLYTLSNDYTIVYIHSQLTIQLTIYIVK